MDDLENVFEKMKAAKEIVDDVSKDYFGFENFQRLQCACGYIGDALTLLRKQQPRVMTLEEVFERSKHMDEDAVWIEFEDEDGDMVVYPAILSNLKLIFEAEYIIVAVLKWEKKYFPLGTYGKKWRCWTSRPSDSERGDTPWAE